MKKIWFPLSLSDVICATLSPLLLSGPSDSWRYFFPAAGVTTYRYQLKLALLLSRCRRYYLPVSVMVRAGVTLTPPTTHRQILAIRRPDVITAIS